MMQEHEISGKWKNQSGSILILSIDVDENLTGHYQSKVGSPKFHQKFKVIGKASGRLLSFIVQFSGHESITAWTGKLYKKENEVYISTLWHMAKEPIEKSKTDIPSSLLSGYGLFKKISHIK